MITSGENFGRLDDTFFGELAKPDIRIVASPHASNGRDAGSESFSRLSRTADMHVAVDEPG